MSYIKVKILIIVVFLFLSGCSSQMDNNDSQIVDLLTAFDFENGRQEWEGGISDYPINYQDSAEFKVSNDIVANSLSTEGKGLTISAENPNGELFYYFFRKVSDLIPNQNYRLDFEFLVYTQLSGTEEGELFLKIGATNFAPELVTQSIGNAEDYVVLNIDKGDTNSDSGMDLVNIGSVKEFVGNTPELISGNSFDTLIEVVSDNNGEVWLIVGVDSGIKSNLTFGMAALTVYYRKQF